MDTKIKTISCYLIGMLLLCQSIAGYTQTWKKLPSLITGQITKGLRQGQDSISVIFHKDVINWGEKRYNIPIVNGKFQIEIDSLNHPFTIRAYIKGARKVFINRIIEPGDTLNMQIDATDILPKTFFKGNNVAKYTCEDSLINAIQEFRKQMRTYPQFEEIKDPKKINEALEWFHRIYFFGYNMQMNLIDHFKNRISKQMYQYLTAGSTYLTFGNWELSIKAFYNIPEFAKIRNAIIENYNRYKYPNYKLDPDIAAYNQSYLAYVIKKKRNELFFKSAGKGIKFSDLYQNIKNTNAGILRDRLLVYLLMDFSAMEDVIDYNTEDYNACLNDAYSLIKDPDLKQIISRKFLLKKGSDAYNFTMPDPSGKMVSLKDFQGKVVLIDVWAVGCVGCAKFSNMFEEKIYPKLKNERNFEVVSIGLNRTKKAWIAGIKTGKYTQPNHINLFTEGLETNHPFTKFYNINAIPFVMLVDKQGKIFSKIELTLGDEELLRLINSALASN